MSTYYIAGFPVSDELYHYGTPRMRWGVRLYQNKDGTLTELGKERYRKYSDKYRSKSDKAKENLKSAESKLADAKIEERDYRSKKLELEQRLYDAQNRAEKQSNRAQRLKDGFGTDFGEQKRSEKTQKAIEKITKQLAKANYNVSGIEHYRLQYENKVDKLLKSIEKYDANSDLYKQLADEGVTKRYKKRNS